MGSSIFPLARAQLEAGTFDWTAGTIRAVMLPPGVVIDYTEEYLQDIPAGSRIAISADIEGRAVNGGWFAGNPVSFGVVLDARLVSQVVLFLDTGNEATSLLIAHLDDEGIVGDPFAPMGVEYFLYPDATFGGFFFFAAVSEPEVTIETVAPMPELRWTAVTSDVLTLLGYHVFRSINGEPFTELAALNPATLTFTDDSELPSDVVIRYYVEARLDISAIEPDSGYFAVSSDTVGFGVDPPLLLGSPPIGAALNETCVGAALQTQNLAGTIVWSVEDGALPDGWSLDTATGAVGGVATKEGSFTYTLRATGTDPVTGGAAYVEREFTTVIGHIIALLHFDGENGGTTFTDETGRSWTRSGNAQTVTETAAIGGAEALFDGNGDYLTAGDHDDWSLGTQDFTLQFWATPTDPQVTSAPAIITQRTTFSIQNSWSCEYYPPGQYIFFRVTNTGDAGVTGTFSVNSGAITLGTRAHYAFSRRGTRLYSHVNGVPAGALDLPEGYSVYNSSAPVRIGAFDAPWPNSYYRGRLDELKFVRGAALYAEDETFTPPTVASDYPVA